MSPLRAIALVTIFALGRASVTAGATHRATPRPPPEAHHTRLTPRPARSPDRTPATPQPTRSPYRAPATPRPTPVASAAELEALGARLHLPIAGLAQSAIRDSFAEARGGHRHEATDIAAPRGTPVLAVDDGTIAKLFTSVPGGLTIYEFSADGGWTFYYAHLDRYADGLREGAAVRVGDLLGYVGTTGNAGTTPHLHFAILKRGFDSRWWEGTAIDPFPLLDAAQRRR